MWLKSHSQDTEHIKLRWGVSKNPRGGHIDLNKLAVSTDHGSLKLVWTNPFAIHLSPSPPLDIKQMWKLTFVHEEPHRLQPEGAPFPGSLSNYLLKMVTCNFECRWIFLLHKPCSSFVWDFCQTLTSLSLTLFLLVAAPCLFLPAELSPVIMQSRAILTMFRKTENMIHFLFTSQLLLISHQLSRSTNLPSVNIEPTATHEHLPLYHAGPFIFQPIITINTP